VPPSSLVAPSVTVASAVDPRTPGSTGSTSIEALIEAVVETETVTVTEAALET
jgi:hypothetical protein